MRVPGRMLLALIGAVAVLLAACGASGASSSPLAMTGVLEVSGGAPGDIGPEGIGVRFVAGGEFGVAILLRNRSPRPLTILDAQTLEPDASLVRQVGTRLVPWNPRPCRRHVLGCPIVGFLAEPYGTARPVAVTVDPGKTVGVQLNFRLADCRRAATSSTASARLLEVGYRDGSGATRSARLPLAGAQLHLEQPAPNECLSPHSAIEIEGPYATSSARAVSGGYGISGGDTCTRTATGGLAFRSAPLQSERGGKPQLTVRFELPRFSRAGRYRTPVTTAALGPAEVFVTTNMSGQTTFRPSRSSVTVTRAGAGSFSGRLDAVVTAYRTPFHVHGRWRCTTVG